MKKLAAIVFAHLFFPVGFCMKLRDPFCLPAELRQPHQRRSELVLRGIIGIKDKFSALVEYGDEPRVLGVGDEVAGYKVVEIEPFRLILKKKKQEKVLWMQG